MLGCAVLTRIHKGIALGDDTISSITVETLLHCFHYSHRMRGHIRYPTQFLRHHPQEDEVLGTTGSVVPASQVTSDGF